MHVLTASVQLLRAEEWAEIRRRAVKEASAMAHAAIEKASALEAAGMLTPEDNARMLRAISMMEMEIDELGIAGQAVAEARALAHAVAMPDELMRGLTAAHHHLTISPGN